MKRTAQMPEPREKQGSLVGAALGTHLGANLAFKGFTGTGAGHRFEAGQFATGYRHGDGKQKLNPTVRNIATYGIGPESTMNYDMGQQLAKQTRGMSKGKRRRFLKKTRKNMAMTKHLRDAPLARSVVPGINRVLDGSRGFMDKLPTVDEAAKATKGQRALSMGLAAGATAAMPDAAIHMGLNAARERIGTSPQGQNFLKNQMLEGAKGTKQSPAVGLLQDLAVSPGSRYGRRLGEALNKELVENPKGSAKFVQSMGGHVANLPSVRPKLPAGATSVLPSAQQAGSFLRKAVL